MVGQDDGWDAETANLIRHKVTRMFGKHRGYNHHDREDAAQESWLGITVAMRRFDPSRASKRTFASRIVSNTLTTLLEHDDAQKRHRRRACGHPPKDLPDRRRDQRHIDLKIDVANAVSQLGSDLGAIVTLFETFTVAEIARQSGLSRQQVRGLRHRLATHLRPLNQNSSNRNQFNNQSGT